MNKLFCIAAIALLFVSCKKHHCDKVTPLNADKFVFGLSGGFCGSCYHYYEVRNGNIYEDSTYDYTGWIFRTVPLSQAKYGIAQPLQTSFPSYFSAYPNATFGCNGCADQQTFYIEIVKQGVKTYWYIDDVDSSIPVAVKPYIDQMRNVITQLAN